MKLLGVLLLAALALRGIAILVFPENDALQSVTLSALIALS